ncbi:MAG: hypothetical protein AAF998_07290, partial [Bacteroidota bacterium]
EYILVEQNEPHIDVYRRMENGFWFLQGYSGIDQKVELASLGIHLLSQEIYLNVAFSDAPGPPTSR